MSVDEFGDHHLFMSEDGELCEAEARLVRGEHALVVSSSVSATRCGGDLGKGAGDAKIFKCEGVDDRGCYRMSSTDDPGRFADYCGLMEARGCTIDTKGPVARDLPAGRWSFAWLRRIRWR